MLNLKKLHYLKGITIFSFGLFALVIIVLFLHLYIKPLSFVSKYSLLILIIILVLVPFSMLSAGIYFLISSKKEVLAKVYLSIFSGLFGGAFFFAIQKTIEESNNALSWIFLLCFMTYAFGVFSYIISKIEEKVKTNKK